MAADGVTRLRVDKWLWHARFFKTRGLAADCAGSGRLRVNGQRCEKPAQPVGPGDVLTFAQAGRIRVIRVTAIGNRRGPASEAATLFEDLDPPQTAPAVEHDRAENAVAGRTPASDTDPAAGAGRPDRRARRDITKLRRSVS
ncbi:MAG: RNA-binding S4 domain-containing protein [Pikeienuella sp.]